MSIVAIIQARTSSSRLPGKVLLPLAGKTVLEHVVERVSRSSRVEEVVVATSLKKEDIKIVSLMSSIGVRVFTGSENDVLDRYYQCARLLRAEHIVRVTSDCPFVDAEIIDLIVDRHISIGADITRNENCLHGFEVEVFTFEALRIAWREARLLSDREHVSTYILRNSKKAELISIPKNIYGVRLVLDHKEDYEVVKYVFETLYSKNKEFSYREVVEFVKTKPNILSLNSHIDRYEGLKISLGRDKALLDEELENLV